MRQIAWFSSGVSSAVACHLALRDTPDLEILYININDQHPDSFRFLIDCQKWFGKTIGLLQSQYHTVAEACKAVSFIKGPGGACCTRVLKKRVRKDWERENPGKHTYIWGLDCGERHRVERIEKAMPDYQHRFPLIDAGVTKEDAHGLLRKAHIRRPYMYELGYPNNNCIGCIKGGMGYWNKIRVDFPRVFAERAAMEREIGAHIRPECYLDELDPERGRGLEIILDDCGIICELLHNKDFQEPEGER